MAEGGAAAPIRQISAVSGPAPRILIVDDVADNRAVLSRRFQRRGYEVVEADGGHVALELIRAQSFDLILLDWMMADIDGIEVLRRIRLDHPSVSLPVIMATAKTQSQDFVEAFAAGANDYITKPVDFAVAFARVETQVGRKRAEEQIWLANHALAGVNEDLERRIAERTAELSNANLQLQGAVAEARAANRSKDEFLANMSHELRTPLNGVIGMAQLLQTTGLTDPQREMVQVIAASGAALRTVVTDLLDIVDLGAGEVRLVPETFQLDHFVRDVASSAQLQARQKGLEFTVSIDAVGGAVHADPSRLRQILLNLLSNAVKFTAEGSVGLSLRRCTQDPGRVVFEVVDTGIGFDPALTDRLFQRFQQADGSLTRAFGGVGLGLSICRELTEQMGGAISAEGRPGNGATFRVELPLPELAEEPAKALPETIDRPVTVLCVEDHPVNRQVAEYILFAAGVQPVCVENGAEALEAYKRGHFDAVLMDMQMPVMDGLTATRAIRSFEVSAGRARTPIVMLTAHGLAEHIRSSESAGADRHLTKPFAAADLLGILAEVVGPDGA